MPGLLSNHAISRLRRKEIRSCCVDILSINDQLMDELNQKIAGHVAARNGHLDCIKEMYRKNWDLDDFTAAFAVKYGHRDVLEWMCEQGEAELDWKLMAAATRHGQLDCLKFLVSNNCPRLHNEMRMTAENGHYECMVYLHENGFPWDASVIEVAVRNEHWRCAEYARNHGCPTI